MQGALEDGIDKNGSVVGRGGCLWETSGTNIETQILAGVFFVIIEV